MNLDKIITVPALAIIGVAALTTIFGRKNTPAVFNALGGAFANSISAALGKGAGIA
jgi:hypothetical protein